MPLGATSVRTNRFSAFAPSPELIKHPGLAGQPSWMAATRESRGFSVATPGEWETLARNLLACENPLLNSRGKPTFVEMRHGEISRKLMLDGISAESDRLEGGG